MRPVTRALALFLLHLLLPATAHAGGLAIFRIDPLGVDAQIVGRLEGLLRIELGRLADATLPTPERIQKMLAANPELQNCTGEVGCLVRVGRNLGVDRVISGNVGGLAGSYVVNLKIVDVAAGKELQQIQEPISGDPDQLIEAVRVAAYGLVAPERLRGAVAVLADQPKADVFLDGKHVGKTPLPTLRALKVGVHVVRVSKGGYTDVIQRVQVRFQKTAQVVVKLQTPKHKGQQKREIDANRPYPWYTRWWFWTAVGVAAAGVGLGLGYAVSSKSSGINCNAEPGRCGL
jgi:hypothetical protein